MTRLASLALAVLLALPAVAEPLPGHREIATGMPYAELLENLRDAVRAEGMGLVTEAGPTEAAARRGETIPGDRVVGVFRNDYAVQVIRLSREAMIEAPIRFHVRETETGAVLAWKAPSHVFAPYLDAAPGLGPVAADLDAVFEAIARRATAQ